MKTSGEMHVVRWMRADRWCAFTGESLEAVRDRIRDGEWAAGLHFRRLGKRTLWLCVPEVERWIESREHVETDPFPKGSRSGTVGAGSACG